LRAGGGGGKDSGREENIGDAYWTVSTKSSFRDIGAQENASKGVKDLTEYQEGTKKN